jgi:hypothetical protein
MKSKKLLLGMLVLTLVFGMMLVGCEEEPEEDVGIEESVNLPANPGEFTFTDIPSKYNGKYAIAEGIIENNSSKVMIGFKSATKNTNNPNYYSTLIAVKIENGSVKIPLYTYSTSSPVSTTQVYSGSDSMYMNILVYNTETISAANVQSYTAVAVFGTDNGSSPTSYPVQFTSGKATKSNNDANPKLD